MSSIKQFCESLPVFSYKQEILQAIQSLASLVVVGETGSGKTTQIPKYLLENHVNQSKYEQTDSSPTLKSICVTQPRRIAAITVSQRVKTELDESLSSLVGYNVRFDDTTTSKTKLRYVTDGILLREFSKDPSINSYDYIIVDEAHERSLDTDIILGMAKKAQSLRKDTHPLKIIVMSATLDVDKFSGFFDCPIFSIPGRNFPVTINHHPLLSMKSLKTSYLEQSVDTALSIHFKEPKGDILVFLTGQAEIERAIFSFNSGFTALSQQLKKEQDGKNGEIMKPVVLPIYASLEPREQQLIFTPTLPNTRKIIFATNIAQTSITVPNVVYVIDSGFVKLKSYNTNNGCDALQIQPISKAAAIQRAGRAGRVQPGIVYRLYSHQAFDELNDETLPEIMRTSLTETTLVMKAVGIADVLNFDYLDRPATNHIRRALDELCGLGALDLEEKITEVGLKMAKLPLPCPLALAVIDSENFNCTYQLLIIASMLSTDEVIVNPRDNKGILERYQVFKNRFLDRSGDHMTLYNIFVQAKRNRFDRRWCKEHFLNFRALIKAESIMKQLISLTSTIQLQVNATTNGGTNFDSEPILRSLASGYRTHLARKHIRSNAFYHISTIDNPNPNFNFNDLDQQMLSLTLHPTSTLNPTFSGVKSKLELDGWIIYSNLTFTTASYLKNVSKIKYEWVEHLGATQKKKATRGNGKAVDGDVNDSTKAVEADIANKSQLALQRYLERKKKKLN